MKKQHFYVIITVLICAGFATAAPNPTNIKVQTLKSQALAVLEEGLVSKEARIRTHAIEVAVETDQKAMLPKIKELAKDRTVPVRFAAVVGLGDMECDSCEQLYRQSLNDPDVNVRIAAAYSLIKMEHNQYSGPLLAATKSADQTVRANAALLLGKLGNRDHIPVLYEVLSAEDSIAKVRFQTVESIARLGDERMYRSKLWALLISKFADDRVMGIRGMGALNTIESREAIATMLKDDIVEIRLTAAEQLARLGDKSGRQEVYDYFQTSPNLNKADIANGMAVMAIGYLQDRSLNVYLPMTLASEDAYISMLGARSVLLQLK